MVFWWISRGPGRLDEILENDEVMRRIVSENLTRYISTYSISTVSSVTWSCLVQQNLSSGVPQQKMLALSSEAGQ